MHGPLIIPNLHVVMIHYPLAMLIAGVLIELFAFLWPRSSFRSAGRWMILIGAFAAIPACFSGLYALREISGVDVNTDKNWADIKTGPVFGHPEIWNALWRHTLYQSIATAVAALVVVIWLGASDRMRRFLHLILLLVMVGSVSLMGLGAWFAGESIYRYGAAIQPVFPPATQATVPSTQPADWTNTPTRAEQLFPPVEQHAIMAGVFTAIALASIGLSFRKMGTLDPKPKDDLILPGDPSTAMGTARTSATSMDVVRTFNPNLEFSTNIKPFVPAGRFWMLAFLIALLTFTGGLFVLARGSDVFTQMHGQPKEIPQLLWQQIKPPTGAKISRLFVHAISGTAIVVLPVIMALMTRFAPREKIILSITTFLLILVLATQVWLGILLLFDTSDGPINRFNPPAASSL